MSDPKDAFALNPDILYLNHAAVAPWPVRTAAAVKAFADENVRQGSSNYGGWMRLEDEVRAQVAALINVPDRHDIALVKNTSEALSFVAYGLSWNAGDEVVISDQEFPSNRIVWESLQSRFGVRLIVADIGGADPEGALEAACSGRTRLLSISSVQYGTGLRLDIARLGRFCRSREIRFCVDAIQQVGALRFDTIAAQADYVMADGHKWMLGPEGLGFFYCCPERRDELRLNEYGWHMVAERGNFDAKAWAVAPDARRFECGSPNMLGAHALHASLSLLLDEDMATVERRVLDNTRTMIELIEDNAQLRLLSPRDPERASGIVTFEVMNHDNRMLQEALMGAGVVCAYRGGGIRFSPHFYNTAGELEEAFRRLTAIIQGRPTRN